MARVKDIEINEVSKEIRSNLSPFNELLKKKKNTL